MSELWNREKRLAGRELYSVATGVLMPTKRANRKIMDEIVEMEGFEAAHPSERGFLWLFDSLNNAKLARNILRGKTPVGTNICKFAVSEDGRCLDFIGPCE